MHVESAAIMEGLEMFHHVVIDRPGIYYKCELWLPRRAHPAAQVMQNEEDEIQPALPAQVLVSTLRHRRRRRGMEMAIPRDIWLRLKCPDRPRK